MNFLVAGCSEIPGDAGVIGVGVGVAHLTMDRAAAETQ